MIRLDTVRLDAPKRTPQGGLAAPAYLTRAGVFVYHRADGSEVRELRPAAEVFKADSLATLVAAPVTKLHPAGLVKPGNFRAVAVGHVGDSVTKDGDKVAATVYVQDGEAVAAIEAGMRQVSCGYTCDVIDEPGVTEAGERYDRIQKNITYNHVALVPVGRAGADVALRLDAAGNQIGGSMKVEKIDGVEYEIDSDAHKAALERNRQVVALKAEADKQAARADVAEGEIKKLSEEIASLKDPARFDAAVAARASLVERARKLGGADLKIDGMTDAQIRSAALTAARPDLRLDGKTAEYIEAAFDLATEAAPQTRADEVARIAAGVVGKREDANEDDARARMLERNRNAWRNDQRGEN